MDDLEKRLREGWGCAQGTDCQCYSLSPQERSECENYFRPQFTEDAADTIAGMREAFALTNDALDIMFDGPDDSDREMAYQRWQRARKLVAALKETPNGTE